MKDHIEESKGLRGVTKFAGVLDDYAGFGKKKIMKKPEECVWCGTPGVQLDYSSQGTLWLCKYCEVDHNSGCNKAIAAIFNVLERVILEAIRAEIKP